ncbi:hypothetical protein VMT65_14405 [Nocardia sp. CDC153]|uniref:hypothetical protein n=1 Tax=Nocardia sp. CDC153 TaxID=3112167 RepID=UPI002DC01FA0|nr:hypothetical protein [Nocardia sp. CDC153]MEC3954227.1 hypothetical protein [Nocardia sp. CDC153]
MTTPAPLFRAAWIALAANGIAILAFGLITLIAPPAGDRLLWRADSLATLGTGLFGLLITVFAFRQRQTWSWWAHWFYPIFWLTHLFSNLPPGKDHIHQIAFTALSLAALLVTFPLSNARVNSES